MCDQGGWAEQAGILKKKKGSSWCGCYKKINWAGKRKKNLDFKFMQWASERIGENLDDYLFLQQNNT